MPTQLLKGGETPSRGVWELSEEPGLWEGDLLGRPHCLALFLRQSEHSKVWSFILVLPPPLSWLTWEAICLPEPEATRLQMG